MSHPNPKLFAPRPGAEEGSAYLAVLMLLVVMTILGLSLSVITQTEVIIGGSERMNDPEVLLEAIRRHELPEANYQWYIDLRRYGSVPHSGFGLGLERTVAWICGTPHIRECIAFPRMMHRLRP